MGVRTGAGTGARASEGAGSTRWRVAGSAPCSRKATGNFQHLAFSGIRDQGKLRKASAGAGRRRARSASSRTRCAKRVLLMVPDMYNVDDTLALSPRPSASRAGRDMSGVEFCSSGVQHVSLDETVG